jgi:peptidoglycan/LPS O-acetylase OafA/YrhL
MVVLFHLWPNLLPGGFAGVDVFFVISGFLISGSLFNELQKTGRIAVANFWAKRARRLFPAAFLVILVTASLMSIFVPPFTRVEFVGHGLASLFYFENWQLLLSSSDYFADSNASPFQHFWSLSVEEQFYVLWPLALLAFAVIAGVRHKRFLPASVSLIGGLSFVAAVLLVASDPEPSYFNSFLRVWQFALGAGLALLVQKSRMKTLAATLVSLGGFIAIGISAFAFSGGSGFPGLPALVPSLGAAAVIIGGQVGIRGVVRILCNLPSVQFLGRISYSLYLWHWPLIVLAPFVFGQALNGWAKLAVFAASVLLAWLTKLFVEDRVRTWPKLANAKPRATFILAALASAALALGLLATGGVNATQSGSTQITLDQAKHDAADPGSNCMTKAEDVNVILCNYGSPTADYRVLLVGDSHAAGQLAAFKKIATEHGWALTLAYKAGCSFSQVERNQTARGVSCKGWNDALQSKLATLKPFDLVVTANYSNNFLADRRDASLPERSISGFIAAWQPLVARGAQVVALRDNPQMTPSMQACFDSAIVDATACNDKKTRMLFPDHSQAAAQQLAGAHPLDLTDLYCDGEVCGTIRNGTYIYRNADHITATYSAVISGEVYQRLELLLGSNQ